MNALSLNLAQAASRFMRSGWFAVLLGAALGACGGSNPSGATDRVGGGSEAPEVTVESGGALGRGAELNALELAQAERAAQQADGGGAQVPLEEIKAGQVVPRSAYVSGAVARKALAVSVPVYRFFNSRTGAHFFTTSETERDNVIANGSPPFVYEGVALQVASAHSLGLSSVHRFYNTQTGVHFYTISESERAHVAANLPQFSYEGVAYYASQVAGQGLTPFYRFYVPSRGFHFYTANQSERDQLIATASGTYTYEGIGYHVLAGGLSSQGGLPHTGVTSGQCYQAGSDTLVACGSGGASSLYAQQDGHRSPIDPMSYEAVTFVSGVNVLEYALTSCVRDRVTGLIWEGKTDDGGLRDKDNSFTNLGDGATGDASAYVAEVNATQLCGFNDWRLPTRQELLSTVHYGITGVEPAIHASWFPNTRSVGYRSADGYAQDSRFSWNVQFDNGTTEAVSRSGAYAVRLVRGSLSNVPRFSFSTVAYGSDASNNLVNDAWTGLQWRRCEEGRIWNGSVCMGTSSTFTHEQALVHARSQVGWRLPNVKELSSLVDLGVAVGARMDPAAFPGASTLHFWTASPNVRLPSGAWAASMADGQLNQRYRQTPSAVRLIRSISLPCQVSCPV